MKKLLLVFICFLSLITNAQHNISGTFSPAEDYSWLIAYRLKAGTQVYTVDTAIKDGKFSLNLPEDAIAGTYRIVYAVPQEEFYFDIIYNGKEDITLSFSTSQGVQFLTSKENILFDSYFKEINGVEKRLINYFAEGATNTTSYQKTLKEYSEIQSNYEKKSAGLLANQFIKANKTYVPQREESIQDFVAQRKATYFDHLDLSNPVLQASGFLTDKLTNYVFTSLPLEEQSKKETERVMQSNVGHVYGKLRGSSDAYIFHVLYSLWTQSSATKFNDLADQIYASYLKTSPEAANNQEILDKIEIYNRLRLGATAPEISWSKGKEKLTLSTLEGYDNYVLVFWSSTCGHCLKELPALHKELSSYSKTKVIAVGLENDNLSWKLESEKLKNFQHVIALGKWESKYATLYNIRATPTYFILDKDKKIIAKPESDKNVVDLLKN